MPSKRDRNNLKLSTQKAQSFKNRQAPTPTSMKYNDESSTHNTNGYLQIKLSPAQTECVNVIKNNVITFVEGPARKWKKFSSTLLCSKTLFS